MINVKVVVIVVNVLQDTDLIVKISVVINAVYLNVLNVMQIKMFVRPVWMAMV